MSENRNLLVLGASSSRKSINKQFAIFTATLIPDIESHIIDLNDYEMPIFSIDREK